jgi:predicted regulator of Ras-like GTPase activity (Roadblock/LC7/MglB family)
VFIKSILQSFIGVSGKGSQLETLSDISSESSTNIVNGVQTMAINLSNLNQMDGFIGACLVDSDSGMVLGMEGGAGAINLEVAAAGNTEVVRAKRKTMKALSLKDGIEDILITLGKQYHLIRPLESNDALFLYVALNRASANLGMARMQLKSFEKAVEVA